VVVGIGLRPGRPLLTADGSASYVSSTSRIVLGLQGHCFSVTAPVMSKLGNLSVDCLLGGDIIDHMGEVKVKRSPSSGYSVVWGAVSSARCCDYPRQVNTEQRLACVVGDAAIASRNSDLETLQVQDPDFVAKFFKGRWTVSWRWSGETPRGLQTHVTECSKCTQAPLMHERYCAELESWISKGWLQPWDGPVEGIIPLLEVFQSTKHKARPVMNHRELNAFVKCHTGDYKVAVCGEKIRKWRQLHGELRVVDLKYAYLQIHFSKDLWKYQVVKYKGVHYALTRPGFGLSCTSRIMTSIFGKVLIFE